MNQIQAPAVKIQNLKKTFDGKEFVVNDLSLEIPRGKITSIIGFSGTGKSVLLKHILGLYKPSSGSIEVLGQDILSLDANQLTQFRCRFGVLFQGSALFDDMTVLENVCFPLVEHRLSLGVEAIEKRAREKLSQVGLLEKDYQKLPSQISGGMQKRTGLARALALDPEIIVYDEPTTGLDPVLTEMVDDLIVSTHKLRAGELTSIIVSHDLHAAFRISDFMVMLNAGKVLLAGTPEEFLNTDIEMVRKFLKKGMRESEPPQSQ